jgi:hypothetical protein
MLSIGSQPIYLYQGAVDMRKSFNGLSSLVALSFPVDSEFAEAFVLG